MFCKGKTSVTELEDLVRSNLKWEVTLKFEGFEWEDVVKSGKKVSKLGNKSLSIVEIIIIIFTNIVGLEKARVLNLKII